MGNMMTAAFVVAAAAAIGLHLWRYTDRLHDATVWTRLVAAFQQQQQPTSASTLLFDLKMIENLPDPARRFFTFAIAPGTPLHTVCEVSVSGKFSLGTKKENPNYLDMSAEQVLAAAPHGGFVWKMQAGSSISGSDGAVFLENSSSSWTRFWLYGLVPVARAGQTENHARSAFGRFVSETLLWCPAAALPQPSGVGVRWEPVNDTTARMIMTLGNNLSQSVDLTVDEEGKMQKIEFPRWTNANAEKVFQLQQFGGFASDFRTFNGYRVPTHVEAGNNFGTEAFYPFFIANVSRIRFPMTSPHLAAPTTTAK